MPACAILAGGASLRFGGGKLSWRGLGGVPLVMRVARALEESGVCGSLLIVASPLTAREVEEATVGEYEVVGDPYWLPCMGPLRGLAAAGLYAGGTSLLVAAGDMAFLSGSAFSRLLDIAEEHDADAAAPVWATGYVQHLAGYLRDPYAPLYSCLKRGVYGRPSDAYRGARRLILVGSRVLGDRDGRMFMSVNTRDEAMNPRPDPPGEGLIDASSATRHYREADRLDSVMGLFTSIHEYYMEALEYHKLGVHHFAWHAWQDYCESAYKLKMTESTVGRGPFKGCRGHGKS